MKIKYDKRKNNEEPQAKGTWQSIEYNPVIEGDCRVIDGVLCYADKVFAARRSLMSFSYKVFWRPIIADFVCKEVI